jgi:nucleoside-diphosphate-sugar epimerase
MKALVTGAAGFVGSHLSERLLQDGFEVIGVDCFTSFYDEAAKRSNLAGIDHPRFTLREIDLTTDDLEPFIADADLIFHQAGQPGVRDSWDQFEGYQHHNVIGTNRLLDATRGSGVKRLVYASSSSVYGNAERHPTTEADLPQPVSPYGVTKLAAEHLCRVYATNFGVPTVSLRYFTVFGPRQRPDMAFHRLIEAALDGSAFPLFGDGSQIRDFTYVDDVVEANIRAAIEPGIDPGLVVNVAGGGASTIAEVIAQVEHLTGQPIELDRLPVPPGDVRQTSGSIDLAKLALGWEPTVDVATGLERQVQWHLARRA